VKPVVIKLGGSLAETGRLRSWLSLVARARRPVVIVPGGGPLADAVRALQRELLFRDEAAHEMAILAMQQMGLAMIALEQRLVAAETLLAITRAGRGRRVPVWLPAKLCAADRQIPKSWSITSDGLAARLAERLDSEVVLVKSRKVAAAATPKALVRDRIVDPAFAAIVERSALPWRIVGPGEERTLAALLDAADSEPPRKPASKRRALLSTRPSPHGRA